MLNQSFIITNRGQRFFHLKKGAQKIAYHPPISKPIRLFNVDRNSFCKPLPRIIKDQTGFIKDHNSCHNINSEQYMVLWSL